MCFDNINSMRMQILDTLEDIDSFRMNRHSLRKSDVERLSVLVESFCSIALYCDSLSDEASYYERLVEKLSNELSYRMCKVNEGFYNPFDDSIVVDSNAMIPLEYDDPYERKSRVEIKHLYGWGKEEKNPIKYSNGKMVSGRFFGRGDVIETCPVRLFREVDMYSERIREFAMPIDAKHGIYGIPFGCATFYRNSKESGIEPNAEYEYLTSDSGDGFIEIRASRSIKKGHEIIIQSDEEDFGNELIPDRIRTANGIDPVYSIKNFRFA